MTTGSQKQYIYKNKYVLLYFCPEILNNTIYSPRRRRKEGKTPDQKGAAMPYITIESGVLSDEQKENLICNQDIIAINQHLAQ